MKQVVGWALAGALLASTGPARAGEVTLSFSNGRVSVVATDASPREILGEWARLGQVRVTNLDRLAGTPVTLQLTDIPESKALETILRGTAGYIAAPRRERVAALSGYDRILLMPGVAPAIPSSTQSPQSPNAGMNRGRPGQTRFGTSDNRGDGPAVDTPGMPASWGVNITRPGPDRRPAAQGSWQSSSLPADQVVNGVAPPPATPLPTSSQVPGVTVGQAASPTAGSVRPGQATAPPVAAKKQPGQGPRPTPTPTGPIKIPE